MAKEPKTETPETYGEVVQRLEDVVGKLEKGDISLEESLKQFEAGIKLVRRGEEILSAAEKRIEQLLGAEGEERAAPLELPATGPAASGGASVSAPTVAQRPGNRAPPPSRSGPPEPPPPGDDDVPF